MKMKNKVNMKKISGGFTLIELMIAMVIGLIILLGLVTLFTSSSSLNRAQTGLAVLQENGRYAITRIKSDIEMAGRKHCATVAMPSAFRTNWDQGYAMTAWQVARDVSFDNGFPDINQVLLDVDTKAEPDQTADPVVTSTYNSYPLDPSYFIRGSECGLTSCEPSLTSLGSDKLVTFPSIGVSDGSRAAMADVLTLRYLLGGNRVTAQNNFSFTLEDSSSFTDGPVLIADCGTNLVANANWGSKNVTMNLGGSPAMTAAPSFNLMGDTRAYNLKEELKNISYFLRLDADPSDSNRMISSLYRSENGNVQQIVQGVERFDVFYLAQLQTGKVARLTADQVEQVSGGGDFTTDVGCTIPPLTRYMEGIGLANDTGCLWRSIYAIEVHLLLNTVYNSSTTEAEVYTYSPDSLNPITPGGSLPSGLEPDRMYRREFTAIVPVRSYTL